ncbi:unnamed protein product [Periconia digitata]|uniref:Fibroin-3 related protein n=1 Tax=Periconia digitata TaxID=1303443 RepID=A0A9W4UQZ8_9PLEO|nr:unnamed protein product [Periconia digitata]
MTYIPIMPSLFVRQNPLDSVKDTLSSWDKCMAKAYCKKLDRWPVIAAIIVGSLIVLTIVICVARCICCGVEICSCCCKCCSCCCPSGGRDKHKRMKSDPYNQSGYPQSGYPQAAYPPAPGPLHDQYRSHETPAFHPAPSGPKIPIFNPQPSPHNQPKPKPEEPEYAHFDVSSKPTNADSLPPMPSWNESKTIHVEEEVNVPEKPNDVELDRLNHNGSVTGNSMTAAAAVGGYRGSPGPRRSPVQRTQTQDSYGFPAGYQNDSFVNGSPQRGPHTSPPPQNGPYGQQQGNYGQPPARYGDVSPVHSGSPVYGGGGGYAQQDRYYDRGSPAPNYPQQQQQQQQYRQPSPVDSYGQSNPYANAYPARGQDPMSMPAVNNYSVPRSYTPASASREPMNASPSPVQNTEYTPPALPSALTAGQPPSGPPKSDSPAPAYPGQQSYDSSQQANAGPPGGYRAFTPGAQHPGPSRTPANNWV